MRRRLCCPVSRSSPGLCSKVRGILSEERAPGLEIEIASTVTADFRARAGRHCAARDLPGATSLAGGTDARAAARAPDRARYRSVNLIYGFYV